MESTLDLVVRDLETGTTLTATYDARFRDSVVPLSAGVRFQGALREGARKLDVNLRVDKAVMERLRVEETQQPDGSSAIAFFDADGTLSHDYEFRFVRTVGPNETTEVWTGLYTAKGARFNATVISDPVPVLIIVAGIGAAACLAKLGIEALTQNCLKTHAQLARDCQRRGGSPQFEIDTTFGMKFKPFEIGCNRKCRYLGCSGARAS